MTTANKFTILRLIFVLPFLSMLIFVVSIDKEMQYSEIHTSEKLQVFIASGILFILAMITDWIDGYIARKTNTVTTFGKLFDPLADKFITTTAFIMLSMMKIIPIYLVVLMVLRDIFVDGSRVIAATNKKTVAANMWGKSKTVAQTLAIILAFFLAPIWSTSRSELNIFLYNIPSIIATLLSLVSGMIYFWKIKFFVKLK